MNRCWKCGQLFAALPDATGLPPVRRDPTPIAATPVGSSSVPNVTAPVSGVAAPTEESVEPAAPVTTVVAGPIRTGSPFAPGAVMTPVAAPKAVVGGVIAERHRPKPPPTGELIRDQVAVAGGIASIVLGVFSVSVAWMANPTAVIGSAVMAVLGLLMGMWGLHSKRRGWALFGMLLCVGAIAFASYSGAMLIYEARMVNSEAEGQIVEP